MGIYSAKGTQVYSAYSSTGDPISTVYNKENKVVFPYNLCIMSFNPQWFTLINSQTDMLKDIFCKNNADIIGFQEMSKTNVIPDVGENILRTLYPYSLMFDHYNYLAIKSKYELSNVTMEDYVSQDPNMNETRGYIKAYFELDGNTICFITTHLELNETYRNAQMAELFEIAENEEYVIITGDFNTVSDQIDSDDYTNMYKQFVDAGYHLANCSNRSGFVKTYSNQTTAQSLEDFRSACDNVIVSPNIEMISRIVDTTKLHYLDGNYIDHCPVVAYLNVKPSANINWTVTKTLTNCSSSNSQTKVIDGNPYSATITPNTGYTLSGATVSITMDGVDITSTVYSNGVISIDSVTGDLVISISAALLSVTSISATYTQSKTIYETNDLDDLTSDLAVTATWSDSSTTVVPVDGYTLSGTLVAGTSTITVTHQGKTTTFNVSVTAYTWLYRASSGQLLSAQNYVSKVTGGSGGTETLVNSKLVLTTTSGSSGNYIRYSFTDTTTTGAKIRIKAYMPGMIVGGVASSIYAGLRLQLSNGTNGGQAFFSDENGLITALYMEGTTLKTVNTSFSTSEYHVFELEYANGHQKLFIDDTLVFDTVTLSSNYCTANAIFNQAQRDVYMPNGCEAHIEWVGYYELP